MSNEHIISEAVLAETVIVSGFRWCTSPKRLASTNLTAKVLCRTHNTGLSPLDAFASTFLTSFKEADRVDEVRRKILSTKRGRHRFFPKAFHVNGAMFERWCLKTLCNLMNSGSESESWEPPERLVNIVFGRDRIIEPAGLGFSVAVKDQIQIAQNYKLTPLLRNGNPIGICLIFAGIPFVCTWNESIHEIILPEKFLGVSRPPLSYRIKKIDFARVGISIKFKWT